VGDHDRTLGATLAFIGSAIYTIGKSSEKFDNHTAQLAAISAKIDRTDGKIDGIVVEQERVAVELAATKEKLAATNDKLDMHVHFTEQQIQKLLR